jgi:hypothetical protein
MPPVALMQGTTVDALGISYASSVLFHFKDTL